MSPRKILWSLFVIIPLLVLFATWWSVLQPFLLLAFLLLVVVAIYNGGVARILKPPIVYYRPTQTPPNPPERPSSAATPPPAAAPLTPSEYQDFWRSYQQGYQAQAPLPRNKKYASSPAQPEWEEYEQPQAHYPEQPPPLQ